MKLKHVSAAALAAASMLLSSCIYGPGDGYGTFSYSTNGYSSSVSWTNASYDANGFPIFGYSYGRPVYGYTAAGAAVFTVAALTALCFVPRWKPAPWYHGSWSYPPRIHRVAAPPHCPAGHRPGVRPPGGMNAPIHRNPGSVLRPSGPGHNPGISHRPSPGGRPAFNSNPGFNHKPLARPGSAPNHKPGMANRPNGKPGMAHNPGRPNVGNRPNGKPSQGSASQFNHNRPGGTHQLMGARPNNRPNMGMNRPNIGMNRPQMGANRPSMGGGRPGGGARPAGGHRR